MSIDRLRELTRQLAEEAERVPYTPTPLGRFADNVSVTCRMWQARLNVVRAQTPEHTASLFNDDDSEVIPSRALTTATYL